MTVTAFIYNPFVSGVTVIKAVHARMLRAGGTYDARQVRGRHLIGGSAKLSALELASNGIKDHNRSSNGR